MKERISDLVPCQPLVEVDGVVRFRANPYVRWMYDKLLEVSGIGLNELVLLPEREKGFAEQPVADLIQLVQLLGRSVGGYEELDFVPDEEIERLKGHRVGMPVSSRKRSLKKRGSGR